MGKLTFKNLFYEKIHATFFKHFKQIDLKNNDLAVY